jgi:nicotinate-nucleotide adenylyltransferase
MTVGLFFGSFNPIHIGHLAIANYMLEFGPIQELWFVVSPHNPLKQKASLLPDYQRLDLVNLAIADYPKFRACDIEFRLPQPSYTIDTLVYLKEKYPAHEFKIIMGADGLASFDKWKNYRLIIENYSRLVYPRPGFDNQKLPNMENAELILAPLIEISSTFIRAAIAEGKDMRFFMPSAVAKYVDEMQFFKKKLS